MAWLNPYAPPRVVLQAQALLRAWVCGEISRLQMELDRSAFISLSGAGDGDAQEEHLALLKSIAYQMRCCQNLFAERTSDPQLGLCVDLLAHLASCAPTEAENVVERPLQ